MYKYIQQRILRMHISFLDQIINVKTSYKKSYHINANLFKNAWVSEYHIIRLEFLSHGLRA